MTNLQLSTILHVGVSTYENPEMDRIVEQMEYDLDDCKVSIDTIGGGKHEAIKVQDIGLVALGDVNCDDDLDFDEFKKDLGDSMQSSLETVVNFDEMLKKYGLIYGGMNFYTPQYYNYESDSLDIRLTCEDEDWSVDKYGLRELVQLYIDTELQSSYDGYISMEEDDVNKVERDDYSVLWAILMKENIYDELKDGLQDFIDEGYSEILWGCVKPFYTLAGDYKVKYKLDYDGKILLLDEK